MMNQPIHAIDLTRHHFWRELGDMVLVGTWVFNDEKEDTEPALVVLPRYRPPSSVKPCVIGLSAAFKYDDPAYLARSARHIGIALGFEDSMSRARRIAEMIHDHLPDLIRMPNDPTVTIQVGEATLQMADGSRKTLAVTDHEQVKQL